MPTTREFKTKTKAKTPPAAAVSKKTKKPAKAQLELNEDSTETLTAAPKRRPGRVDPETSPTPEVQMQNETQNSEEIAAEFEAPKNESKVEINFAGSELLRSKFPKPFEVAEAVASEWTGEAKFDHLPISHPLANWAAQQGLLKAKEIEKKVVESPQVEKAAMAALTLAMRAQATFEQLRSRMKRS